MSQQEVPPPEGKIIIPNVTFDFEGWYRLATDMLNLSPEEAKEWVQKQWDNFVDYVANLKADEWLISDGPFDEGLAHPVTGLPIYGFARLLPLLRLLLTDAHLARAFAAQLNEETP